MSYRGRGRGGFNNSYNNNSNNRNVFSQQDVQNYVSANSVPIEILGWNGASQQDCVNFISRKCRIVLENTSVDPNTGVLKGYVKTMKEANELSNWSGVKFAGQSLKITKGTDAGSMTAQLGGGNGNNTIEIITKFLNSRYQADIKLLNLNGVKLDPTLASKGFFASLSTTSKFFPALMKIAGELKIDVHSVDLSNNELTDLTTISALAQTFPTLKNLSLSNNRFSRLRVFETWKNKLNFLRELIISGNPLVTSQTNEAEIRNIKLELMRTFPRLLVLDGEILRNEQVLMDNLTFPFVQPQGMFFQDEEIRNMSTNFISNYYKLWDSNRQELLMLYQNESQFSMQVDSSHPYLIASKANSYNSTVDFGYYLNQSRNLTRVSAVKSRMSRLATGPQDISRIFSSLPKTKHDLIAKPHLFSMESFRFPQLNGIMICLHGSFEEVAPPDLDSSGHQSQPRSRNSHQKPRKVPLSAKSFDRTFVVISAPNGSMVVASDLLLVRPLATNDAWNKHHTLPGAPAMPNPQPQASPSPADLPPDIKSNLNPIQQELLVKVVLETKLNLQYAIMLCEQSNWDYNQCSINFKNSVASIPKEAYTTI